MAAGTVFSDCLAGAMPGRRALLIGAMLGAVPVAPRPGAAQPAAAPYPARPVRIVVPNPPGGSTDIMARLFAERLSAALGQNFVVENRPGAGGNIGMEHVAKSAPDGHTLGAATVTQWVVNDFLYERMPYDTRRDLAYVAMNWELANILSVPAAHVPARTAREFIDWARARPEGVTYGTPGVGTSSHLLSELLGRRYGIRVIHVPFRGAAEAIPAMLRGDVQFAMDGLASYLQVVREGLVRALAITSAERSPLVPETPTMAELGMEEFSLTSWGGFAAPAGTPEPILRLLAETLRGIVARPEMQERGQALAARLIAGDGAATRARLDRERPIWGELVRISGARAN